MGNRKIDGLFPMCVSHELKDLSEVPHRDIPGTDLAIVAGYENGMVKSVAVDGVSISEEEILSTIESREKVFRLGSLGAALGLPGELVEGVADEYILTNEDVHYGASVLGNPDALRKAAETFGEGFYVLPSSVHEVILIPDSKAADLKIGAKDMQQIVSEINQSEVRENERLSNSVYHFDGEKLSAVAGPATEKEDTKNE